MPAVDDAAKIVQQARATHLAALQSLRAAVDAEAKFDLGASAVVSETGADTASSGIRETAPPHVGPGETAAPHVPAPGHP